MAEVRSLQQERRARLFRNGKPTLRPAKLLNEDGSYGEDMGVLWAAYKAGSFPLVDDQGLEPAQFGQLIVNLCAGLSDVVIAEDVSNQYAAGRGPVAFVGIRNDGWRYEPHVDFFAWATPRNVLRSTVAFLQFMRYHKDVGVCIVRSLPPHVPLFKRIEKYAVLNYVGKIFRGTPRGDEHMFSVAGKKRTGDMNGH